MLKSRAHLLGSAASAILAIAAAPAFAADQGTQAALSSGNAEAEIVVTARRREERLQDVPVAITALSQKTLETQGIRTVSELRMVAPGLNAQTTSVGGKTKPIFELRGIFPNDVLVGQDQSVGVYMNDIYLARPIGATQTLFDISNAQVLYGPQGTLFGRNTTAGAVLINTNKPTDRFEGQLSAGIGNYSARQFGAVVNLPLDDTVQVRLAGQREVANGYTTNITTGQRVDDTDNFGLRGSIRIAPTSNLENVFVADYYRSDTAGQGGIMPQVASAGQTVALADGSRMLLASTAILNYTNLPTLIAQQQARGPRLVAYDNLIYSEFAESWGLTNTTTYEATPNLTVKNIFGYRRVYALTVHDSDKSSATPLAGGRPIGSKGHQVSNEFQLQGNSFDGKLTWIVGAYYFREGGNEINTAVQLQGTANYLASELQVHATNISKSVFAQGTYKLTDQLSLTAGGRYTWDTRNVLFGGTYALERGNPVVNGNRACLYSAAFNTNNDCKQFRSSTFRQPTYTISLDYKPSSDLMMYVAHRRGYRSGGYNGRATNIIGATPFQPEKVTDIEIGAKGQIHLGGDALLTFDAAAYRIKYKQLQRSITAINPETNTVISVIRNIPSSTIKGFELKSTLRPVKGLTLAASWAYSDGQYDTFTGVLVCPALPTVCASGNRILTDLNNLPTGSAKHTVSGSVTVTPIDSPEMGTVDLTGTMSYRSAAYAQNEAPLLYVPIPAYSIYNLSLNWENIAGSPISAQAYVRNLTNKNYVVGALAVMGSIGFSNVFYGDPRTYGLNLKYKF